MNNPDSAQFWPYTVKNAVMYFPDGNKQLNFSSINLT
jgi:hypothetical protein